MYWMDEIPCEKPHRKCRVKLFAEFGKAKPGSIVEAEVCPTCGVHVASNQLGYDDTGGWNIPSELAEVLQGE